jgi:hypothetical protein
VYSSSNKLVLIVTSRGGSAAASFVEVVLIFGGNRMAGLFPDPNAILNSITMYFWTPDYDKDSDMLVYVQVENNEGGTIVAKSSSAVHDQSRAKWK